MCEWRTHGIRHAWVFFKCIWWIDTEPYVSCFVCTQISTPEHTQSFIHLDAPEQWVHNLPRNAYIPIRARPCFAHAPLRKQLLHNVFKVAPGMWRSIPGGSGVSHSLKSNTHTYRLFHASAQRDCPPCRPWRSLSTTSATSRITPSAGWAAWWCCTYACSETRCLLPELPENSSLISSAGHFKHCPTRKAHKVETLSPLTSD